MSVDAITFDFWGTLFRDTRSTDRHAARARALQRATGATEAQADRALNNAGREFFRVHVEEQRNLTPPDAVRLVLADLGRPLDDDAAAALARAFATAIVDHPPDPVEGALEAVRAAAGVRPVALVCDSGISPGASLRVILERHGFSEHLRHLTFSDEVGVSKPQRPMFEKTAAALGVAPERMLHIGDLEPTDIDGIHGVEGTGALFAGVNDRFVDLTAARYTYTAWADFLGALPRVLRG